MKQSQSLERVRLESWGNQLLEKVHPESSTYRKRL
jgi:hypothetical protein